MNSIRDNIDRSAILSIAMISVLTSLLTLSVPIAAQTLINLIAFGKLMQPVVTLSMMVLVLMLALGALNIWQTVIIEIIQQKLMVKIGLKLTHQFTHLSLDNFSTHHGPELVNRFFEIVTIKKSLASILLYGINLSLQLFFGLLLLLLYHPLFLIFDGFILLSIALIVFIPYRKGIESAKSECLQKHQVGAWLEELLINRYLFRFHHHQRYALAQSDKHLVSFLKSRNTHFRQLIIHEVGFYILSAIASSLLLGLGGYLVINNQLSLGQLVAAEIVLGALIYTFRRFGVLLENYYDLVASEHKINAVIKLPTEVINTSLSELFIPIERVDISIQDTFSATASLGNPLLINSPQADLCHNFVETLLGFHQTCPMTVWINQQPCRTESRIPLRQYTLLIQEPEWFAGSILDNLLLNYRGISIKTVIVTLDQFDLTKKIFNFENGLETMIYDWQTAFTELELVALMLVRALLMQPQLLIIDRALDGFEDDLIQQLLAPLLALEKTVLIVMSQKQITTFSNRTELV